MVVSIYFIDTLDLFSAILSAVGGGGIGAIVADSRLGSSLSQITFRFLNMQYLYFRTHRHYSKKGSRWSAYEVKTEKILSSCTIHNERYNRSSLGRCSGNEPKSYLRER
jgi:hypothetical protein